MHRLLAKFGIAIVALAAFLGIDLAISPTADTVIGVIWLGQVTAFVISGVFGFIILLVGWHVAGGGRMKSALK